MPTAEERAYGVDIARGRDWSVDANGVIQTVTGEELLRQAIRHRLTTQPGALVHRPGYGCGLKRFRATLLRPAALAAAKAEVVRSLRAETRIAKVEYAEVTSTTIDGRESMVAQVRATAKALPRTIDEAVQIGA